jgi:hypothetical protein
MTTNYEALYERADKAGEAAAEAAKPTPIIVGQPSTPLGSDIDYSKPTYYIPEGLCGFAWVKFPGNTGFGRWAKKTGRASASYGGGLQVWVRGYGQSVDRKTAYAQAFAAVLRDAGVKAYAESRLD